MQNNKFIQQTLDLTLCSVCFYCSVLGTCNSNILLPFNEFDDFLRMFNALEWEARRNINNEHKYKKRVKKKT